MGHKAEQTLEVDAVAMTRRIRDAQHAELEGRSWEERAAYYREQARALHRRLLGSEQDAETQGAASPVTSSDGEH